MFLFFLPSEVFLNLFFFVLKVLIDDSLLLLAVLDVHYPDTGVFDVSYVAFRFLSLACLLMLELGFEEILLFFLALLFFGHSDFLGLLLFNSPLEPGYIDATVPSESR